MLGGTGQRQSGKFLQQRVPNNLPFPCKKRGSRSKIVPQSVHQLRPGSKRWIYICISISKIETQKNRVKKNAIQIMVQFLGDIDIVAAVGDSLTSATAANSAALWEVLVENRGLSWCIGGLSRYIMHSTSKTVTLTRILTYPQLFEEPFLRWIRFDSF